MRTNVTGEPSFVRDFHEIPLVVGELPFTEPLVLKICIQQLAFFLILSFYLFFICQLKYIKFSSSIFFLRIRSGCCLYGTHTEYFSDAKKIFVDSEKHFFFLAAIIFLLAQ